MFNHLPGVELCTKYTYFFKQIGATALLKPMIKDMQVEYVKRL
jgi:hypothetical protein